MLEPIAPTREPKIAARAVTVAEFKDEMRIGIIFIEFYRASSE
jgi:hypothetical protein